MKKASLIGMLIYMTISISSCSSREKYVDKDSLLGTDYRLFQNTPAWDLAKAVRDGNEKEIKRIVTEKKVDIDYQESRFGSTLLLLAVMNEQYSTCKILLELGADPNKHDTYEGTSPMIYAAGIDGIKNENTKFLKLMLVHGGNPNDLEVGESPKGSFSRNTPLLNAIGHVNTIVSSINRVAILINAGANINFKNEFGTTPLGAAMLCDHYDVALFLLKKGADYMVPILNREGKNIMIEDILRDLTLPIDSKEFKLKMEIVEFLKKKGIEYRNLPIPDYIIKEVKETYPNSWKEYLEKY